MSSSVNVKHSDGKDSHKDNEHEEDHTEDDHTEYSEENLEEDRLYQIGSALFEDENGNNLPLFMGSLIKVLAQQNELHAQLLSRIDNLTEAVQRIANTLEKDKK